MSVEVRQEDFEQAARYYCAHPFGSSKQDELAKLLKRAESEDIDALSYLFAAHRHQAEEAMRERCAEIAERYPSNESYVVPIVRGVAHAIRSMRVLMSVEVTDEQMVLEVAVAMAEGEGDSCFKRPGNGQAKAWLVNDLPRRATWTQRARHALAAIRSIDTRRE